MLLLERLKELNWSPSSKDLKNFLGKFVRFFLIIGLIWIPLSFYWAQYFIWTWKSVALLSICGISLGIIGHKTDAIAILLFRISFFLVCILDTAIVVICLTPFFFLILAPFGILLRITRKFFGKEPNQSSGWVELEPSKPKSYYRQF